MNAAEASEQRTARERGTVMQGPVAASRRQALQGAGVVAAGLLAGITPRATSAHEGHDHAPKTILDLKGKLVRIVRPDEVVSQEFIQDRVTIHVDAEGRIVDLVYG